MFDYLYNDPLEAIDIREHLPTLRDLASECTHITELGTRKIISTWAFLEGMKKGKIVSVDINKPEEYGGNTESFENACKEKGIDFEFKKGDSTKIDIEETDLLFIDTIHTYDQVSKELKKHADKARKYIVFHDTVSCPEIVPAIQELNWKIVAEYTNNNGLTVVERKLEPKSESKSELELEPKKEPKKRTKKK